MKFSADNFKIWCVYGSLNHVLTRRITWFYNFWWSDRFESWWNCEPVKSPPQSVEVGISSCWRRYGNLWPVFTYNPKPISTLTWKERLALLRHFIFKLKHTWNWDCQTLIPSFLFCNCEIENPSLCFFIFYDCDPIAYEFESIEQSSPHES